MGGEEPLEKETVTHSSILAWKNSMDREAWQATVHGVYKESGMTEQRSMRECMHYIAQKTVFSTLW